MPVKLAAISCVLAVATAVTAEPPPAAPDITQLAWLEGCWTGEGFGGEINECWIRTPGGNRLTGIFQSSRDGVQQLSEIFILDEFEDGPAIRLKHFHADMTGWEERDGYLVFRLLETGPRHAVFDALEYRLDEDGVFTIDLRLREGEVVRVERMTLRRASIAGADHPPQGSDGDNARTER